MKNSVRNRSGRARYSDLADAARAEVGHMRIRLIDEIDIELRWRVGVDRDVIFRKIGIHDPAGGLIRNRPFKERGY